MSLTKEDISTVVKETIETEIKEVKDKLTSLETDTKELKAKPYVHNEYKVGEKVIHPIGKLASILYQSSLERVPVGDIVKRHIENDATSTSNFLNKKVFECENNKGLLAGVFNQGGVFIPQDVSAGIIPLLVDKTVVRAAGCPTETWRSGNISKRKNSTGYTAYWVGEAQNITVSSETNEMLVGNVKKLTALANVSNDALRYSDINLEGEIEKKIVMAVAEKEDIAFIEGTGTAGEPKGMINWAGNTNTMTATPSAITKRTDLLTALKELANDKIPMKNVHWFMNNTIFYGLLDTPASSTYNGDSVDFVRSLSGTNPTLFGYPVHHSNLVTSQYVICVDLDQMLIGQGLGMQIEFVPNAAFSVSGTAYYGAQEDTSLVRAITEVDFLALYSNAISLITGVTWGS